MAIFLTEREGKLFIPGKEERGRGKSGSPAPRENIWTSSYTLYRIRVLHVRSCRYMHSCVAQKTVEDF